MVGLLAQHVASSVFKLLLVLSVELLGRRSGGDGRGKEAGGERMGERGEGEEGAGEKEEGQREEEEREKERTWLRSVGGTGGKTHLQSRVLLEPLEEVEGVLNLGDVVKGPGVGDLRQREGGGRGAEILEIDKRCRDPSEGQSKMRKGRRRRRRRRRSYQDASTLRQRMPCACRHSWK